MNGEKTATAEGDITIEDTVSYKHLIPGKAYTIKGILMDMATGKHSLSMARN
ncbi:MAG: VaFE repeat-containing surface-anchored protein [Oscillospiraceae bacterium]